MNNEEKYLIDRNEKGNLYGVTNCKICNSIITFEENVTSDVIATAREFLPINGNNELCVTLRAFTKCPNCGYRFEHHQVVRYK
ncbi:MAG: hypothetical protein E7213_11105 [Clostridium sp.]|nr:hypothetical protein [Clostridium sp.]